MTVSYSVLYAFNFAMQAERLRQVFDPGMDVTSPNKFDMAEVYMVGLEAAIKTYLEEQRDDTSTE